MTGRVPFHYINGTAIISAIAFLNKIPKQPPVAIVPQSLWNIWVQCWAQHPADRPAMTHIAKLLASPQSDGFDFITPVLEDVSYPDSSPESESELSLRRQAESPSID